MNLRLIREPSVDNAFTPGLLLVDSRFFCFTVEDVIRERAGVPVDLWKVQDHTAIPQGRYRVVVSRSQRFGVDLPEVLNVPGFTGIRLHSGNRATESSGCILPGLRRNATGVLDSRMAMSGLMSFFQMAKADADPVWLTVENPL